MDAGATAGPTTTAPFSKAATSELQPVVLKGSSLPMYDEAASGSKDPAIGMQAPEIDGRTFSGTDIQIKNDGHAKVVMFFAHWCPHCQREVPLLSPALANTPDVPGVEFYAVATGTDKNKPNYPPSKWLAGVKWPTPIIADSSEYAAATAYGLSAYPFFVAIDSDGKVIGRAEGEISVTDFKRFARTGTVSTKNTSTL